MLMKTKNDRKIEMLLILYFKFIDERLNSIISRENRFY